MKKIIYYIFISFLAFHISLCTPPKKDSYDKKPADDSPVSELIEQASESIIYKESKSLSVDSILAINKQVWDSIGWKDSTSSGIKMPLYKMVECGKPVDFKDLLKIYGSRYMDSCSWVLKNLYDMPAKSSDLFPWIWWYGKNSILARLGDFPTKIMIVSWSIDYDHSIFMYYKCVDSDSLVPIDGFIFRWNGMPGFSQEMERNL